MGLTPTGVAAGSYTNAAVTVGADGRITSVVPGAAPGGGYNALMSGGSPVTARGTLNMTGPGVSCVDNSGSARTDCTFNDIQASPGSAQTAYAALLNTSYPNGNLTLKEGNVSGVSGYGVIGSMAPTDANGAATWYDTVTGNAFFGTKKDWVRDIGWNLAANGVRIDTSDAAIGDQWESHYDADATHSWVERHIIFIGTDGTYNRPWTLQVARTAGANPIGYTNFGIAADVTWFSGNATGATQNFVMLNPVSNAAGQFQANNSSQIRLMTNNSPQLVQINAAGNGTYQLAYVAADNNVYLCDTTTGCKLQGTSISAATSGQVSIAGNSGVGLGDGNTGNVTINTTLSGYMQYAGGPSSSVFVGGGANSSGGTTTVNSPTLYFRDKYWTGADNANDISMQGVQDSVTPTSHVAIGFRGTNTWNLTSGGAVSLKVGSSIASATTIAPVAAITHITGTTTIATITAPPTFATSGIGGQITLVFDGVAPWSAGGNIFVAGTPTTAGTAVIFTYDNATSKWYPSRTL